MSAHPGNLHALTGAYVLDALDAAELAAFERHLATCAECREEVGALRAATARLGATQAAPVPGGLRARVLAEASRTPQARPDVGPLGSRPSSRGGRPGRAPTARTWLLPAAAAAVVGSLAVGGVALDRAREARAEAARMSTAMHVLAAPDAVTHDMALGSAHLVTSREMGAAVLMGADVPPPDGGVYQVWMMHTDGSPAPGPTFLPDAGEVMAVVEGDLTDVAELMVTVEPTDGDATMSTEVVAVVEL